MKIKHQQPVIITPQAGVFAHKQLKSVLIEKTANSLKFSVPYYNGKIVLLPKRTPVKIEMPKGQSFFSEINNKDTTINQSVLEIALPYQIIKKNKPRSPRIITVTSGKGGAGKTTLLINVAVELSRQGLRVCLVDCDLGTANIDVLLNLHARYSIQDVIEDKKSIFDILLEGPSGTVIAPGSSGFQPLTDISEVQAQKIINNLGLLEPYIDIFLIDTGPGISNNVMFFNELSDEIIMLTTTEPHSITDAYAMLKVLMDRKTSPTIGLVVNRAENKEEAEDVAGRIISAAKRFLSLDITNMGYVVEDAHVYKSIKRLYPCLLKYPQSEASHCYKNIASKIRIRAKAGAQNRQPAEKILHLLPF